MSAGLAITRSQYWQSLQEAGDSQVPVKTLPSEFPDGASEWLDPLGRRSFLKLMSASIALAGVGACTRQPLRAIVPYVRQPEELIPGRPLFFATALTLAGFARGVLVETHEGRPTKIEGNPEHPASGGGLRVLTRHETSPTFRDQIQRLSSKYPAAVWHEYEPVPTNIPGAVYHFDKAEIIFSIGADFLSSGPASLIQQRDFAAARRVTDRPQGMNRLYVVESTPSLTGAMADHRISSDPKGIADLLRGIRIALEPDNSSPSPGQDKFISALVGDLRQSAGKSLVVAGPHEAPAVQEFARWCNELLGNLNVTVDYFAPDVGRQDLGALVNEINAGSVETLMIIGGNPVYDAPADLEFARALAKVPNSIHIDLYANETAEHCRWHIPEAHVLESWSDACAFDGTATIMQPVIEPLFAGRSRHQLLAALLEEAPAESYEIVRGFWEKQLPPADFEKIWRKSLHDGIVANWRAEPPESSAGGSQALTPAAEVSGLYLLIRLIRLFLVIKSLEYSREISEHLLPGSSFHIEAAQPAKEELFFYIYWLMTGVHALHVTVGIFLILIFAARACFTNAFLNRDTPVDLLGLYWHFVDIVWVFLFPLLYLVDRHS